MLLAIGLKGGVELARYPLMELALPGLIVVLVATLIPLTAFPLLHRVGRLPRADAASIAAHYGSVSVVTFAVASSFLAARGVSAEGYMVVFLVLLEFPALMIGVAIARRGSASAKWGPLLHEVFSARASCCCWAASLSAGSPAPTASKPLDRLFFDLFRACWPCSCSRWAWWRPAGSPTCAGPAFLLAFATVMPLCAGLLGVVTANFLDLSVGGAVLLATLYASASYIAAPAAMRIAVPEANPAISIGAALGITFPFNLLVGIPAYHWLAIRLQGVI